MAKKILLAILGLACLVECGFPIGGFLMPEKLLGLFQIGVTPDTLFFAHVAAWSFLFVAIICGMAFNYVRANQRIGWTLSYVLGLWWIGIGSSLWLIYGRTDNLFLDALKGLIITASAFASRHEAKA